MTFSRKLPWSIPIPWVEQADGALFDTDNDLGTIPTDEQCYRLWDQYDMLDNIKAHCQKVADFATAMAKQAVLMRQCPKHFIEITRAAGLLHDLAKSFCLRNGGSHATLGAAWVMEETGNPRIAQAIIHHVEWPWEFSNCVLSPALLVGYADRRVRHDQYVTLDERYTDLLERYAKNDPVRYKTISAAKVRAAALEQKISEQLELPLNACTIDCGRLVPRA